MNASFPLKEFRESFAQAAAIVPSRTTKEVLQHVKLSIRNGKAALAATDSEQSLQIDLGTCEVSGSDVEILLPPKTLSSILREVTGSTLDLDIQKSKVVLSSGLGEWALTRVSPDDFPPIAAVQSEARFELHVADLVRCLTRTIFATDVESSRYAIGGVNIEVWDGRAIFSATDSRRLAVDECLCKPVGAAARLTNCVVHRKAVSAMISAAEGKTAELSFTANSAGMACGRFILTSQLVQGRFPDYRKVIPSQPTCTLSLTVGPLLTAVRQASILTTEDSRGVRFSLTPGLLQLSSQANDVGNSRIELPVSFDGPELGIKLDPRFIADFLKTLEPTQILEWQFTDAESASLLTIDSYRYVVMPLGDNQQ